MKMSQNTTSETESTMMVRIQLVKMSKNLQALIMVVIELVLRPRVDGTRKAINTATILHTLMIRPIPLRNWCGKTRSIWEWVVPQEGDC